VSPEQAEMSGLDIDTRSDIYSGPRPHNSLVHNGVSSCSSQASFLIVTLVDGLSRLWTPADPGGIQACSRWLSEARATPPGIRFKSLASWRDASAADAGTATGDAGTPAGVRVVGFDDRWCRSFVAQPPATGWEASGFRIMAMNFEFGRLAKTFAAYLGSKLHNSELL
jgi:hypothetical protein